MTARLKEIGSRPGGELQEGAPILSSLLAVDAFLGIKSHLDCSSTDANIPLSMGIPAVSIGAGGQGWGFCTPPQNGSIRMAGNWGFAGFYWLFACCFWLNSQME